MTEKMQEESKLCSHTKNRNFSISFSILTSLLMTTLLSNRLFVLNVGATSPSHGAIVESWADEFGKELYEMAQVMTKVKEIKDKYQQYNAEVVDKGDLIHDAVENVGRMFRRKIVAVRCIASRAEELAANFQFNETNAENFQYYSSKYSTINGNPCTNRSETKEQCIEFDIVRNATETTYLNMTLKRDKHFYHISVNTEFTSAHVPTNVYDKGREALEALMWSEDLDSVFIKNYKTDPALSWQYFGSETGILRHYPAKSWEDRDTSSNVDVYDCRKRSWYIETATCSKDIIILLDRSGSMFGYLGFLAKLTIKSLLDTFSNNDFFNIMTFSANVTPLVKCFQDELVQATPENIKVFNDHMTLVHEGYANETSIQNATIKAFDLLKKYRIKRNCNSTKPCNQAIMLITDNIQGNFTEVFEKHNRGKENETEIPVRIFTYLLGKDQSNVKEMETIACSNRGRFAHIQTLDEVQEKVLDYVSTIALPLVLQGIKHPPTWTHAFKDVTYKDEETYIPESGKTRDFVPPRLMIAVGVPAYKQNSSIDGNRTQEIGLLGVASTDVPVDDIDKLTLPYKLGVNAYPFIVSNNGYVLLHPDLRPMEIVKKRDEVIRADNGTKQEVVILKDNYNSIDFTEVEQIDENMNDSNDSYRPEIGPVLKELRRLSLSHSVEKMLNVSVRFNYDKMRRVSEEKYDYYFAPLNSTPFTLGLAIPSTYGQTLIKVRDEIHNNIKSGLNMSEMFVGQNWKVHPDWVYCKFHYMEYHSFNNSEDELLYFLKSFYNSTWKWSEQYEAEMKQDDEDEEHPNCQRETLAKNGYYCNKELVQLLVFDAKVTNASYGTWEFESRRAEHLISMYNATLRFVATMSGLTRWQFIFGETEVEGDKEFGDYYTKAIDETWYKSAVLQHKIDPESFVYSVPHDDKDDVKEEGDIKVMASHAIFRTDGYKKAPGCVVGFQFTQQLMNDRFMEITSKVNCDNCFRPCYDDLQDCYVIDNNGYIILSEDSEDTGKFFGDVQGRTMKKLVDLQVFKTITVYDYQALCIVENPTTDNSTSGARLFFLTPFNILKNSLQWLATELIFYLARINLWAFAESNGTSSEENGDATIKKPDDEIEYEACDKKATLYVMQQEIEGQTYNTSSQAELLYFSRIPHSNLMLVVIGSSSERSYPKMVLNAEAQKINYTYLDNDTFPCHKKYLNNLERRRLDDCFTEDCREDEIIVCSRSAGIYKLDDVVLWTISLLLSIISTN